MSLLPLLIFSLLILQEWSPSSYGSKLGKKKPNVTAETSKSEELISVAENKDEFGDKVGGSIFNIQIYIKDQSTVISSYTLV